MTDMENIVPEYAFHDISHRASVFRTRLIEEFQLLDNIVEASSVQAPQETPREGRGGDGGRGGRGEGQGGKSRALLRRGEG